MQMNGRPFVIVPDAPFANNSKTEITIQLQDDGSALYTENSTYCATPYARTKKYYAEITPEDRRRHIQEMVADVSQSATLEGDFVTDFNSYPGKRTFSCRIKDFAVIDKDYYYFNIPCGSFTGALGTTTDERKNPLYWGGYSESHLQVRLVLPPSFQNTVIMPQDVNWTQPSGRGEIVSRKSVNPDHSITFTYDVNLTPDVIPQGKYQELKDLSKTLYHAAMTTVLLKK